MKLNDALEKKLMSNGNKYGFEEKKTSKIV
jgi:hypothetical protein